MATKNPAPQGCNPSSKNPYIGLLMNSLFILRVVLQATGRQDKPGPGSCIKPVHWE